MIKKTLAVISVVILIALGVLAYSFFKPPEEASAPIEAIPVVIDAETQAEASREEASELVLEVAEDTPVTEAEARDETAPVSEVEAVIEAEAIAEPDAAEVSAAADEAEVAEPNAAAEPATDSQEVVASSSPIIFEIVPAESEVRFLIDEVLRGSPFTVVGTTDQVAGEFAVDANDLSIAQIGPILVNARTLATDDDFRNRAIKNRILTTDAYEFITFTPTEIVGLNGSGAAGESYDFQIAGDLTIRDVTQPVTFDASATAVSETRLEGSAATTIRYDDFGLVIPAARVVSAVADEVTLEIDFVARAKENES